MPDDRVTPITASILARFLAIFSTVFLASMMSGFSTRPTGCASMALSPSLNLASQPPFFFQQSQPPPYSALPLMMAAIPQTGHVFC